MNDQELKHVFAELAARDRQRAPGFDATMSAARARAAGRPRLTLRLAAALALLALAAGVSWRVLHRHPEEVAIGSWRSPTEWLLAVGSTSFDSVPDVRASVIRLDGSAANTASPRAGHAKGDTI